MPCVLRWRLSFYNKNNDIIVIIVIIELQQENLLSLLFSGAAAVRHFPNLSCSVAVQAAPSSLPLQQLFFINSQISKKETTLEVSLSAADRFIVALYRPKDGGC